MNPQPVSSASNAPGIVWRYLQWVFFWVGLTIITLLWVAPDIGIHALWNGLIPLAPALVVLFPGFWRNICPMSFTSNLARKWGWSKGLTLSKKGQFRLQGVSLLLLGVLVPFRHVLLDTHGSATAVVLLALGGTALAMGFLFQGKSGWCAGLCPVHPVEKLYGSRPAVSFQNTHCTACADCVAVCPDSVKGMTPGKTTDDTFSKSLGLTFIGAFPGFVWGWFQVPDFHGQEGFMHLGFIYGMPLLGALVSFLVYLALLRLSTLPKRQLTALFAATAVICYYHYRLPALIGFGPFPGDGMLVDLRGVISEPWIWVTRALTAGFFSYWLLLRKVKPLAWHPRPPRLKPAS